MRLLRVWVVALLVLAVFAGCGGETTPPAEEPAMEQPAMEEPTAAETMVDTAAAKLKEAVDTAAAKVEGAVKEATGGK